MFFFAEYYNKLKFSAGLRLLAMGVASLLVAACGGTPVSRFVYAVNFSDNTVLSYTVNGGLLRLNGYANAGVMPNAIALHPSLKYAYVANWGSNTVSQFNISAGGMLTAMTTPTVPSGQNPVSLAVDPQGIFAFVLNASSITAYTIDAKAGALDSNRLQRCRSRLQGGYSSSIDCGRPLRQFRLRAGQPGRNPRISDQQKFGRSYVDRLRTCRKRAYGDSVQSAGHCGLCGQRSRQHRLGLHAQ